MSIPKAPPFDRALVAALDPAFNPALAAMPTESKPPTELAAVLARREAIEPMSNAATVLTDPEISHEEVTIPGPLGDIPLVILKPVKIASGPRPVMYFIHGGAQILGNRYFALNSTFPFAKEFDAVVISVEYRLAPEFPAPAGVEDCYAGLEWVYQNAAKLSIDPERIIVAGQSAGGGLAAGVALLARDKKGPPIFALKLTYPMLDDRCTTVSVKQYMSTGPYVYNGEQNVAAWDMVLPGTRGTKDVSIYSAAARAEDLSGLPQTFISVGDGDPFRDEDLAFASKLWHGGVSTELHVWPGAWHGFDFLVPTADISVVSVKADMDWLKRILK